MKGLCTFLLGAAVGAVAAALLTPTTGEELRARIKVILQKHGLQGEKSLTLSRRLLHNGCPAPMAPGAVV